MERDNLQPVWDQALLQFSAGSAQEKSYVGTLKHVAALSRSRHASGNINGTQVLEGLQDLVRKKQHVVAKTDCHQTLLVDNGTLRIFWKESSNLCTGSRRSAMSSPASTRNTLRSLGLLCGSVYR